MNNYTKEDLEQRIKHIEKQQEDLLQKYEAEIEHLNSIKNFYLTQLENNDTQVL